MVVTFLTYNNYLNFIITFHGVAKILEIESDGERIKVPNINKKNCEQKLIPTPNFQSVNIGSLFIEFVLFNRVSPKY